MHMDMALNLFTGGLLGLLWGSFANVVIHRLPLMLEREWAMQETSPEDPAPAPWNLAVPGSHCPHCQRPLRWHENIPVLSFVWLRGRCAGCHQAIAWRYPLVELLCAALMAWCFAQEGLSWTALAWSGYSVTLVCLAFIDWDTTLLPDQLTQPLTWAGLLMASLGNSGVSLQDAVWGAAGGYLFLWSVCQIFRLITGKDGMGQGDFKLMAALGAWLGWQAGIGLILIASLTGVAAGLLLRVRGQLREGGYFPFGPFLAAAGLGLMIWGPWPL